MAPTRSLKHVPIASHVHASHLAGSVSCSLSTAHEFGTHPERNNAHCTQVKVPAPAGSVDGPPASPSSGSGCAKSTASCWSSSARRDPPSMSARLCVDCSFVRTSRDEQTVNVRARGRSSPAPADHPVFIDVLPPPDASNVRSVSAVVPVAGRKLGLFLVRGERMEL